MGKNYLCLFDVSGIVEVMVCWHDNMSVVITTDKYDFYNLSVIIYEDCCIHLMALKLRLHPIVCSLKTMFCFLSCFYFYFDLYHIESI